MTYELTQRNPVTGRGGQVSDLGLVHRRARGLRDHSRRPRRPRQSGTQLIALGLDPRTGEGARVSRRHRPRLPADHDRQRPRRQQRLHAPRAPRTRRRLAAWRLRLQGVGVSKCGTTSASGASVCWPPVGASRRSTPTAPTISAPSLPPTAVCPVPFFKRYFLGGSNSLRGWGRFEVSPLSAFGLPIGGLSLLEMSTEFRAPLFGKVSLVAFVDAGSVAAAGVGRRAQGAALRRGPGPSLPDADWTRPRRLRPPAQSDSRSARRRRARDHATGASISAWDRRSDATLGRTHA